MRSLFVSKRWFALALVGFLAAGCLISGTFVVVQNISFTGTSGLYYYPVDVTNQSEWQQNKDKIDLIEAVGFELYVQNNSHDVATFNVYVDQYSGNLSANVIPSTATQIIDGLKIHPGPNKINYHKSLQYIENLPTLRALAKTGKFDVYAQVAGADHTQFTVDSAKVVLTVSVSQ